MTAPPRRRRRSPIMLAGWLFADLFLVLMLTALATQGRVAPKPPPGAAPSPGPSASAGRTPCPVSYELKPVDLQLTGLSFAGLRERDGPAVRHMIAQVRAQLREQREDGRYAGLILAFGLSTYDNLEEAEDTAKAAGAILTERLPRFRGAKVRVFKVEIESTGDLAQNRGNQLNLSVYFFVRC